MFKYSFGSHVTGIETFNVIRDMSVHFSSNFTFKFHVESVLSQSFKLLGFVYRMTKSFIDSSIPISLYKSTIRTKLEYCSSIWFPS